MTRLIADRRELIRQLCVELAVKELRVFGSAVTDRFDERSSDIDVLVEFRDPERPGIADRFLALANGLEDIFQRPVDLVTRQAMKNPVFRETVEASSESLYAA